MLSFDALLTAEKVRREALRQAAGNGKQLGNSNASSTSASAAGMCITSSILNIVTSNSSDADGDEASAVAAERGPFVPLTASSASHSSAALSASASPLAAALASPQAAAEWITDVLYLPRAQSRAAMRRLLSAPSRVASSFPSDSLSYFTYAAAADGPFNNNNNSNNTSPLAQSPPPSLLTASAAFTLGLAKAYCLVVLDAPRHRAYLTASPLPSAPPLSSSSPAAAAAFSAALLFGYHGEEDIVPTDESVTGNNSSNNSNGRLFVANAVQCFVELLKAVVELDAKLRGAPSRGGAGSANSGSAGGGGGGGGGQSTSPLLTDFVSTMATRGVPANSVFSSFTSASSLSSHFVSVSRRLRDHDDDQRQPMPLQFLAALLSAVFAERSSLAIGWLGAWASFDSSDAVRSLAAVVETSAEAIVILSSDSSSDEGATASGVFSEDAVDSAIDRIGDIANGVFSTLWGLLVASAEAALSLTSSSSSASASGSTRQPFWMFVWRFASALMGKSNARLAASSSSALSSSSSHGHAVAAAIVASLQNGLCGLIADAWESPDLVFSSSARKSNGSHGSNGSDHSLGGAVGMDDAVTNLLLCFLTMVPSRRDNGPGEEGEAEGNDGVTAGKRLTNVFVTFAAAAAAAPAADGGDADGGDGDRSSASSLPLCLRFPLAKLFEGINGHFSATTDPSRRRGATVAVAYTQIMAYLHPKLADAKRKKSSKGAAGGGGGDEGDDDDASPPMEPLEALKFEAYPQCLELWVAAVARLFAESSSTTAITAASSSAVGGSGSSVSVVAPLRAMLPTTSELTLSQQLQQQKEEQAETDKAATRHHGSSAAAKKKKIQQRGPLLGSVALPHLLSLPLPQWGVAAAAAATTIDHPLLLPQHRSNTTDSGDDGILQQQKQPRVQLRGRIVIRKNAAAASSHKKVGDVAHSDAKAAAHSPLPSSAIAPFGRTAFVEAPKHFGTDGGGGPSGDTNKAGATMGSVRTVVEGLRMLCGIGAKPNESERDRAVATEAALRALPSLLRGLVAVPMRMAAAEASFRSSSLLLSNEPVVHHSTSNGSVSGGGGFASRSSPFLIVGGASEGVAATSSPLMFLAGAASGGPVAVASRDRDEMAMLARRRDPYAAAEAAVAPMVSHAMLALVCCETTFPTVMQAEMDALRLEVLTLIIALAPRAALHQASSMLFHSNYSIAQRVMLYHGIQAALRLWAGVPIVGTEGAAKVFYGEGNGEGGAQTGGRDASPLPHQSPSSSPSSSQNQQHQQRRRVYPPIEDEDDEAHQAAMASAKEAIAARVEKRTRRWGAAVRGRRGPTTTATGGTSSAAQQSSDGTANRIHLFAEGVVTALLEYYDHHERAVRQQQQRQREEEEKEGHARKMVSEMSPPSASSSANGKGKNGTDAAARSAHSFSFFAEGDMLYAPAELLRTLHLLFEQLLLSPSAPAGTIVLLATRVVPFLEESVRHPHPIVRAQAWMTTTTVLHAFGLAAQSTEEPAARRVLFGTIGRLTPLATAALGGGSSAMGGGQQPAAAGAEASGLCRAAVTEFINLAMSLVE